MIKTKAVMMALAAITAATTTAQVQSSRGLSMYNGATDTAIPLQPVGDTMKVKPEYSPALHCRALKPDMDVDIISACAVKRVGWLKL